MHWNARHERSGKDDRIGVNEPTEQQKSLVDEALYLRGRIVAAYAQVEFLSADISVKLYGLR